MLFTFILESLDVLTYADKLLLYTIFFICFINKNQNNLHFLMKNRQMKIIPIHLFD